jgi:hypothetical protein
MDPDPFTSDPYVALTLEGETQRTGKVDNYLIQPLVELYGGCMVVLKVS